MKTTVTAIAMFLTSVLSAFAASGAESEETGILVYLFIGFGALIIVFQFVPGIMLFLSMLKGLFSKDTAEAAASKEGRGE